MVLLVDLSKVFSRPGEVFSSDDIKIFIVIALAVVLSIIGQLFMNFLKSKHSDYKPKKKKDDF